MGLKCFIWGCAEKLWFPFQNQWPNIFFFLRVKEILELCVLDEYVEWHVYFIALDQSFWLGQELFSIVLMQTAELIIFMGMWKSRMNWKNAK